MRARVEVEIRATIYVDIEDNPKFNEYAYRVVAVDAACDVMNRELPKTKGIEMDIETMDVIGLYND